MNPHLQRGLVLLERSRYQQAEPEFRQAIAQDPGSAYLHAMLALTLAELQNFKEAGNEIAEALQLDPGMPFVHYVHARILTDRQHYGPAEAAIAEAIELDPEDADFRSQQAQIFLNQKKWQAALESAEQGLALDPEHIPCTNLRAMALVKLGRKEEAGATIDAALARNPEDAVTHANQGWTLLHAGQHAKALEHFRESLRLDPGNEWARQGIIEALKARNVVYALLLKYFLWMARLSDRAQWMVIIGGFIGMRFLSKAADANPGIAPFVLPLQVLYLAFVFLTWTAHPLFNLLLRLNKFGRMVLNREEIIASNWVGACVGLAVLSLLLGLTVYPALMLGALVFGFSVVPLAALFQCPPGWPRQAMTLYTLVVAGAGLSCLAIFLAGDRTGITKEQAALPVAALGGIFLIGILGSSWVGNFLITRRVQR